jgi:hypothetical protein
MNLIRRFAIALYRWIFAPTPRAVLRRKKVRQSRSQPAIRREVGLQEAEYWEGREWEAGDWEAESWEAGRQKTEQRLMAQREVTQREMAQRAIVRQPEILRQPEIVQASYPADNLWNYAASEIYEDEIADDWIDDFDQDDLFESSSGLYYDSDSYSDGFYYASPYPYPTRLAGETYADEDDWEEDYGLVEYHLARLGGDVFIEFSYEDDLDEAAIVQALSHLWAQAPQRYQNDFSGTLRLPLRHRRYF